MNYISTGKICTCLAVGIILIAGCSIKPAAVIPAAASLSDNLTVVVPSTDKPVSSLPSSENKTLSLPVNNNVSVAQTGIEIGNLAPDFVLKTFDDRDIKLSDFRGKNIFLHFWDIGCPKCVEEMPHIQRVWESHQKNNDLMVLAVNLGGSAELVRNFMKGYGYTFTALLDSDRVVNRLYDEPCCPGTFLIDTKGIIKGVKMGAFQDASEIEEALNTL